MSFPDVASGRRPLTILDLLVVIAIASLPLAALHPPTAPDMAGLSAMMLGLGGLLWWLPGLAARRRALEPLVLPAFVGLTVVYLVVFSIASACDARGAALIIGAQLVAMVYASLRW